MEWEAWSRGLCIMFVNEDASSRRKVRKSLEEEGYQVLTAATSVEALVLAADYPLPIDVLITDTEKRVYQNGMELASCFQMLRPETRIILTQAVGGKIPAAISEFQIEIECLDYPFTKERLLEAIERSQLSWSSAEAA